MPVEQPQRSLHYDASLSLPGRRRHSLSLSSHVLILHYAVTSWLSLLAQH